MFSQQQLVKTVLGGLDAAQSQASARLGDLEGDARRVFSELVEKGRASQRDVESRLNRVREGRLQQPVVAMAGGLRRWADRLERFARPTASAPHL